MYIPDELVIFTDGAEALALKMSLLVDEIHSGDKDTVEGCKELDKLAREQNANMDTIKDLAYRLSNGETRVTKVGI